MRLPETLSTSSCRYIIAWQNYGALLCAVPVKPYRSEMLHSVPLNRGRPPGLDHMYCCIYTSMATLRLRKQVLLLCHNGMMMIMLDHL